MLPLVFVATCAYLFYSSVMHARSQNAGYVALAVMLSGTLVLAVLRFRPGASGDRAQDRGGPPRAA